MRKLVSLASLGLVGALSLPSSALADYSSLVVFGDSLSDSGYISALTQGAIPGAPYWQGRFSNGENFADVLAGHLGFSNVIAPLGGNSYAFGGAETTTHEYGSVLPFLNAFSLNGQINSYLGRTGGVASGSALYSVYIGANDLFGITDQVFPLLSAGNAQQLLALASVPAAAAANAAADQIERLVDAGAKNILVPNLPDLALTPRVDTPLEDFIAHGLTVTFNDGLKNRLDAIRAKGVNLIEYDVFSLLTNAVAHPADYGFENVTTACLDVATSTVCANPDKSLFWDEIHPTAAAHKLLGDGAFAAVQAVPEPESWAMLLGGLAFLMSWRIGGRFVATKRAV